MSTALCWFGIIAMLVGGAGFLGIIALARSTPTTARIAAIGGVMWIVGVLLVLLSVVIR